MKMEDKHYPPRFRVAIQANSEKFFKQSKFIMVNLLCGNEMNCEPVQIPAIGRRTLN